MQFAKDFRSIDFDGMNNVITFDGASKSAFDKVQLTSDNSSWMKKRIDAKKALVNALLTELSSSQSKMKQFKLSSQTVAASNANKGAMILTPDAEWLKKYMGTTDEEGKYAGLFTEGDYNNILANGITVIADSKAFNNDLYRSGLMTPFEAHIDYAGAYSEKSPYDPETSYTIKKNEYGTGEYTIMSTYRSWDPNKNDWGELIDAPPVSTGPGFNVDNYRNELQQGFVTLNRQNIALKNL